jgi:predicted phage baseplate assembly protein
MPLEAPELDTRDFEDLFREARLRIPRYNPEWTDFNESDPGITLLQLFAWLTETMLFQMNRVPERSYIKFLQLLGLELRPAQPATAHLTFAATPGAKVEPVRRGARIAGQPEEGGEPLPFETEEGLSLIAVPLANVLVFDGSAFREVTALNQAPGEPWPPLGFVPQVGSALYLGFEHTDPPPAVRPFPREMRWRVFLPEAVGAARAQRIGERTGPAPVTLEWEYRPAEDAPRWLRLNVFKDDSAAFTREGDLVIEGPAAIQPSRVWRIAEPRYWIRARLAGGAYPAGLAPRIDLLRPNTVAARQLTTVRDEVLGDSEGLPDQIFTTRHRPVEAASFSLFVEGQDVQEEEKTEEWKRVDDLLASGPDEPHYVLSATRGEVRFGDGVTGRIPPAGTEIVARHYRWGGGKGGNVGAGLISTPLTPLPGVDQVTNLRPAVGGDDEQTVEELKLQAPGVLRHRNRAVSPEDFAALAEQAGGVARATALALAHPDHPGVEVPGAVTVVIVPEGRSTRETVPPRPSADLLRSVCTYLDPFRLLTTEVYVRGADFQEIKVSARISARAAASFDAVARDVAKALDDFLDPRSWPFGKNLYPTSFFDVILDVPDVVAVETLSVEVDGRPHDSLAIPVTVPPGGLVFGRGHAIVVQPEEDR